MANQKHMDGGVNRRRCCPICHFQIDYFILQPAHDRTSQQSATLLYNNVVRAYHSRNLPTHSLKSPRVSYFGYTTVTTFTAGSLRLTSARRCSGNSPNVASSPYRISMIRQSILVLHLPALLARAESRAQGLSGDKLTHLEAVNENN